MAARPEQQPVSTQPMRSVVQGAEPLTPRAVVLSLVAVVALSVVSPYVEIVIGGTQIGALAPPAGALLALFFLAGVANPLLRLIRRRRAGSGLSRQELVAVYVVLMSVAVLTSCQFAQWVVPVVTGPFYYATPENRWGELNPLVPTWWYPHDQEAVRLFYEGLSPGQRLPWQAWLRPLVSLGPFVFVLYGTMLAICALMRRQWVENERLVFPLVQLPLDMSEEAEPGRAVSGFFRDRLMWLGALLPIIVHGVNGLHNHFPGVPAIPMQHIEIGAHFPSRPWSALNPFFISIYFALIGFAFLCGRDVPFSIWLFYLLFKAECVFANAVGWNPGGESRALRSNEFPLIVAQQDGSLLALVGVGLWAARRHLRQAWCAAWAPGGSRADAGEPMPYRAALLTIGLGTLALAGWTTASGMPFWLSLCLFVLTFAFMLGVYRLMAEGGVNFLWAAQSGPNYIMYSLDGGSRLGARTWLVLLSLPYFIWNFKGPVGPQALEGFKLTTEARVDHRRLTWLMLAGMAVGMVAAYVAVVWLVQRQGGGVVLDSYRYIHVGHRPFDELRAVLSADEGVQAGKLAGFALSAAFLLLLAALRWRLVWWRLHPVGYAASTVWSTNFMWFSVLVGSSLNWLILRYGGLKAYRRARSFFLGLILGDFLMMGVWFVVDAITGVRGFQLFGH